MDDRFAPAAATWVARLGLLRNVVRQEVVRRQLTGVLGRPGRALDVGAGQGTQAIALARDGWTVDAAEPDPGMRSRLNEALDAVPPEARARVRVCDVRVDELDAMRQTYDLVLCHGVLMYLESPDAAVGSLAGRVAPGGAVSIVARNAQAMAWRPALRGDWAGVLAMLAELSAAAREGRDPLYRNEIGVSARADSVEHITELLTGCGLSRSTWFGVRVATDGVDVRTPVPEDQALLASLLDAEEALGRTEPYRRVATLFHVVGWRDDPA
ncbi:MAG TPA: methyltransferase [Dermatophilaceae bacterium]|nr:methyltransferase [Dermatophilaceae bacterium]